jgi:hypothetical protein
VPIHVLRALERLALLEPGNRDERAVAWAVGWSLEALPGFVSMGDAVWPARMWGEAGTDGDSNENEHPERGKAEGAANMPDDLCGWLAFVRFRQVPAPIPRPRLHGNRKHGRRSKSATAGGKSQVSNLDPAPPLCLRLRRV